MGPRVSERRLVCRISPLPLSFHFHVLFSRSHIGQLATAFAEDSHLKGLYLARHLVRAVVGGPPSYFPGFS
jgi:hypothetical protein